MAHSFIGRIVMVFLWCLSAVACNRACAAIVVYIDKPGPPSLLFQQVDTVKKFYGLEGGTILLVDQDAKAAAVRAISNPRTVAVVLSADSLSSLDPQEIFSALKRRNSKSVPLLIAGISDHTDGRLLERWSATAITGCKKKPAAKEVNASALVNRGEIAGPLGGTKLPVLSSEINYLTLRSVKRTQLLIAVKVSDEELPVFVKERVGSHEIFFAAVTGPAKNSTSPGPYREPLVFAPLAPLMMFLDYSAGERAWHATGKYANLTIDDVWLRQPYGSVNFENLLSEMEQHDFHTTLAFIPWNFDRSQTRVVSMFRANSNRFSVCVHGNNHDHQEFGSYSDRPLNEQAMNIKQGLARMAKFSELTNIPFDPVMVFPHSISPKETLTILKRYNFAGTVNFINVPLGAETPQDPEFALRTATLAFSNFPSLRRYSAEAPWPESQLAIDAFLGNPMLFYVHQGFFAQGSSAFNKIADLVNQLQPETEWKSLGDIMKHLYLQKLRDDGDFDIRTFSPNLEIKNDRRSTKSFFIEKDEDFLIPLTVFVDGKSYPYQRSGARLHMRVPVPAGGSRTISITYEHLNVPMIDVSKNSFRVSALRRLSDFRDDVVSRTAVGRELINAYTQRESEWNRALTVLALLCCLLALAGVWRKARRMVAAIRNPSVPDARRGNLRAR